VSPGYTEFDGLMRQLEDWYADDVRAMALDALPGANDEGTKVLHVHRYPGPPWRRLWAEAEYHDNLQAQAAIINALEEEIYGLDHSPSNSGPASGLHRGTREWNLAIATADGSLRAVARRFGLSHTEVRRIRLQYGRNS
jgi:hypothetical protein